LLSTPLPSITSCFLALKAVASSLKCWINVPGSGPSTGPSPFLRRFGGGGSLWYTVFVKIHDCRGFRLLFRISAAETADATSNITQSRPVSCKLADRDGQHNPQPEIHPPPFQPCTSA
jgi:hypothetical protein